MNINFILDKRVCDDEKPEDLKVVYREGLPLVNVAQFMKLFNLKTLTIVDNSLDGESNHNILLIDKHRSQNIYCDYNEVFPILLHLPISVIIEKSVNLTDKVMDFLKRLLDEAIKEK